MSRSIKSLILLSGPVGRAGPDRSAIGLRVTEHVRHEDAQSMLSTESGRLKVSWSMWIDATDVKVINAIGKKKIAERVSRPRCVKGTAKVKTHIGRTNWQGLLYFHISLSHMSCVLICDVFFLCQKERNENIYDFDYS